MVNILRVPCPDNVGPKAQGRLHLTTLFAETDLVSITAQVITISTAVTVASGADYELLTIQLVVQLPAVYAAHIIIY